MVGSQASKDALRVAEADPRSDPRWDDFVTSRPDGLVYHRSEWLEVLARESGREPFGLLCEDDDHRVQGVLPLLATPGIPFRRGALLTGRRLASLPRTPVAGPLAASRAAVERLVSAAVDRAVRRRATLQLKVCGSALDGGVDGLVGIPWSRSYVVTLPNPADELRFGSSRNHGRVKWAIGKARKEGVGVRAAETESELRTWYGLYLETMRHHVVPPRPYRHFSAQWHVLRPSGLMELLVAEQHQGGRRRMLAGSIFLRSCETVVYAFNGRRLQDLPLRPNDMLMWHAIHAAHAAGFRRFDLGEVAESADGLSEFKKKWGAEENWLYRYYFPPPRQRETSAVDASASPLRAAAWRRLPLRVTALVGSRLYRYL